MSTTCTRCNGTIPDGAPSCPMCDSLEYPHMQRDLSNQLKDLNRRWSLHPFSSGWRMVDIFLRVIVIFVLVWFVIATHTRIKNEEQANQNKLAAFSTVSKEFEKKSRPNEAEIGELLSNYKTLLSNLESTSGSLVRDQQLHIYALLGFIALLAVSALGSYRTNKELAKLRSGFEFLFTYEGRRVLDRIAPAEPPKQQT